MYDFSDFSWSFGAMALWVVGGLIGMLIYYVPTMIAAGRHHNSTLGIFLLNLLLGWTFLGWIIAFIWSLTSARPAAPPVYAAPPPYPPQYR